MSREAFQDTDGLWMVGGMCVGRKIADTLFAEEVASNRYLIRSTGGDPTFAKRVGEVFGSAGDYQACRMRGEHVGNERSLVKAAELLASTDDAYCDTERSKHNMVKA